MPWKIATAPDTFMRLMTIVFSQMLYNTCLADVNNINIFERSFNKHLNCLKAEFIKFISAFLKLKPSKCYFGKNLLLFLYILFTKIK